MRIHQAHGLLTAAASLSNYGAPLVDHKGRYEVKQTFDMEPFITDEHSAELEYEEALKLRVDSLREALSGIAEFSSTTGTAVHAYLVWLHPGPEDSQILAVVTHEDLFGGGDAEPRTILEKAFSVTPPTTNEFHMDIGSEVLLAVTEAIGQNLAAQEGQK